MSEQTFNVNEAQLLITVIIIARIGGQNENSGNNMENKMMHDAGIVVIVAVKIVYKAISFVKMQITMIRPKNAKIVVANAPITPTANFFEKRSNAFSHCILSNISVKIGINATIPSVAENDIQKPISNTANGDAIKIIAPANDRLVKESDLYDKSKPVYTHKSIITDLVVDMENPVSAR